MSETTFQFLLRLGDNALILSHRLSELCGKGPALEEDIALANVALDLLGQAGVADVRGETEAAGRDEDALAYLRNDRQFFNVLLVERPNGSYADTLMRQFYFDCGILALEKLQRSTDSRVAAIAEKAPRK